MRIILYTEKVIRVSNITNPRDPMFKNMLNSFAFNQRNRKDINGWRDNIYHPNCFRDIFTASDYYSDGWWVDENSIEVELKKR